MVDALVSQVPGSDDRHRLHVVSKILTHLGLPTEPPVLSPARAAEPLHERHAGALGTAMPGPSGHATLPGVERADDDVEDGGDEGVVPRPAAKAMPTETPIPASWMPRSAAKITAATPPSRPGRPWRLTPQQSQRPPALSANHSTDPFDDRRPAVLIHVLLSDALERFGQSQRELLELS